MAGKYTLLEQYLRDLPDDQREITLGFEQTEDIEHQAASVCV